MIDKVRAFITDNNLIPQGSRVIAALSGGSDSMALFNILLALKDELGFALEAAHVNHGIRQISQAAAFGPERIRFN